MEKAQSRRNIDLQQYNQVTQQGTPLEVIGGTRINYCARIFIYPPK